MYDLLKVIPQYLLPKQAVSALAGCLASVKNEVIKNAMIYSFIAKYQVDMKEALNEDPTTYASFNDFFIRQLKPACRPLAKTEIISPVDGQVSELGDIEQGCLIQAKGKNYSVHELFAGNDEIAQQFSQGQFLTVYLSPRDYHRVHMPADGRLISMSYIPGALFSVQPCTARVIPKLFARNERLTIFFETKIGLMALVMVGATIVGSIETRWHGQLKRGKKGEHFDYKESNQCYTKGDEIGLFKLGSTVVLLFAKGKKMNWDFGVKKDSRVLFGEKIGHFIK